MISLRPAILEFGSKQQIQSIGLRYEVLRKPLGLIYDPEDLKAEANEVHMGMMRGEFVVAVLLLKKIADRKMKMRQVAVSSAEQGSGIGSALVDYCEKWCLENGITEIELHAREAAVSFYLKAGYHIVGDRFEEVGIPHFKMIKNLN